MKGARMPLTEAIKDHARTKLASLDKVLRHPSYVHVEAGKSSAHHKGGPEVFQAEITIDSNGHTYFVQTTGSDLYPAIDQAVLEIGEVIKQGRGKRQTLVRKGRMMLKQLMRRGG